MPGTYTQLLVQLVFSTKYRDNIITESHREPLEKYIVGIVKGLKSKPLAIYCNPDHCHLLVGLHPSVSVSELANKVKSCSSKWVNEQEWFAFKFRWQNGYGAFSYSNSSLKNVAKYIENQPIHHKRISNKQEFIGLLDEFEIDYQEQYV